MKVSIYNFEGKDYLIFCDKASKKAYIDNFGRDEFVCYDIENGNYYFGIPIVNPLNGIGIGFDLLMKLKNEFGKVTIEK